MLAITMLMLPLLMQAGATGVSADSAQAGSLGQPEAVLAGDEYEFFITADIGWVIDEDIGQGAGMRAG